MNVSYSMVQKNFVNNGLPITFGKGILLPANPRFAGAAAGNFHLQSSFGHWTPGGYVTDTVSSPALAKGDRILTVNGDEVDLAAFELAEPALILVKAPGGATRHLRLDPWNPVVGVRPVGGANVLDPAVVVF